MSLATGARLASLLGLSIAALGAQRPQPAPYAHVATLPSIVDGQPLRTFVFDTRANRLYAGSDRGLFWVDLAESSPRLKGPLVRKDILRIEIAPDLGRLFFFTYEEIGYVDVRAPGAPVRLAAREWAIDLAYEPRRRELYVATRSPRVLVFDARTGERGADIAVPGWWAQDLEAIPGRVFLGIGGKQGVYAIDAATHELAPWPLSASVVTPAHLEADPAGAYLFLANGRDIVAVDAVTAQVIGRVIAPTPPAIAFDPGTGLLLALWDDDPPPTRIVAFRVDANGLTEVARLKNPAVGRVGVEPTSRGFIQNGWRSLLVWSAR